MLPQNALSRAEFFGYRISDWAPCVTVSFGPNPTRTHFLQTSFEVESLCVLGCSLSFQSLGKSNYSVSSTPRDGLHNNINTTSLGAFYLEPTHHHPANSPLSQLAFSNFPGIHNIWHKTRNNYLMSLMRNSSSLLVNQMSIRSRLLGLPLLSEQPISITANPLYDIFAACGRRSRRLILKA